MKILVTGGAGFIGSHILDACLAGGHSVAVLDDLSTGSSDHVPDGVPLHMGSIIDASAVERAFELERPDAVCHQAAQMSVSRSVRDPVFDAEVNAIGLLRVLESSVRHGVRRFVFASSGGVLYGEAAAPATEESTPNPVSPYGITKWVGERYLSFYAATHGLEAVALRYSNVYGPRQNPHGEAGVVAIFARKLLAGEPATINGDGRYVRDYVFGPDVARANLLALTSTAVASGTVLSLNVGTGIGTDVIDLESRLRADVTASRAARSLRPPPAPIHGPARPGDLTSNIVDASRAERVLGWRPTVWLPEGLRRSIEWFASARPR
ncbi:MAG: NAD-dependent epimerase/dehydratase family protein [Planctomycetaceae bacterium]